ncbi:YqaA family protein [Cobetia sp. UCD-24C]|uniref:YqaA family protein n=1 Tax=Cobetia sp. UCD-24C TaxID=1716176 RepID=UPI0006CA0093|nr:VTT domain-containing protein [Cobetia sp. UCD-24C]KPM76795.1 alkaline phosphatase [Cobetia sp. UCD-24C]
MWKLSSASDWLDRLNQSRHAMLWLFIASMLETLLIPIPIEVILIPWMLRHPERRWRVAAVALAGNLTAALLGFYLGAYALAAWGDGLISFFGGQQAFEAFQQRFSEQGFLAIMLIGIVPIPFQSAMLVAGASGYPVGLFLLAALVGRGVRYFGLAALVALVEDQAMALWQRYSRPLGVIGLTLTSVWLWQAFIA